jgi:hypothetical protein
LSPSAQRALDALAKYSALAWPILKTQCELAGHDPASLGPAEMTELAPRLVVALGKFTSPAKAQSFERDLRSTAPPPRRPSATESTREGGLMREVLDVLEAYTPLAASLFETQCARVGVEPSQLSRDQLKLLIPALASRLGRFGSAPPRRKPASDSPRCRARAEPHTSSSSAPALGACSMMSSKRGAGSLPIRSLTT